MKTIKLNLAILLFGFLAFTACDEIGPIINEPIDSTIEADIESSVTWKSGNTYIIDGTVRIGNTSTVELTIEPGAIIKFKEGAGLDIAYWADHYAKVTAIGTAEKPIIFTSNSPGASVGDWDALSFFKGAIDCVFEYCVFEYGGEDNYEGNIYIEDAGVSFKNCEFRNSATHGIVLSNGGGFNDFDGNEFVSINNYPISIHASLVHTIKGNNVYENGEAIYVDTDDDFVASGNYTWTNQGIPYVLDGTLRVGTENTQGLILNIEPGVEIRFTEGSQIDFAYWDNQYATVKAIGTEAEPIRFTSNNPAPEAGDWKSLNFYDGAVDCEFNYCEFSYGGSNEYNGNIYIEESTVSFTNSKFLNSASLGIRLYSESYFGQFSNNMFSGHAIYPIEISPNAVSTIGAGNSFEEGTVIYLDTDTEFNKSGNFTWLNQGIPYLVDGSMRIGSVNGTNLTIDEGTQINFTVNSQIDVAYWDNTTAQLIANGTVDNPVVFTSNSPSPSSGDWDGIFFYEGVNGSNLDYCKILYAGGIDYYGAIALDNSGMNAISITNSEIAYSASYGITVDVDSSVDITSVTFVQNGNSDYYIR